MEKSRQDLNASVFLLSLEGPGSPVSSLCEDVYSTMYSAEEQAGLGSFSWTGAPRVSARRCTAFSFTVSGRAHRSTALSLYWIGQAMIGFTRSHRFGLT